MKYDQMLADHTPCPLCGSEDVDPWPHPIGIKDPRVVCHGYARVWVSQEYTEKRS